MSNVLRNLMLKIGVDFTDAQKGFNKLSKELKSVGKSLTNTGKTLTNSITVPVIAAVSGLTALTVKSAEAADEVSTLAVKFGLTTDQIQEFQYMSELIDVSLDTLTGTMVKLTKNMDMARQGSKDQKEAFDELGISYQNADGSLKDAQTVWREAIDKLSKMTNETDRNAYSMRIFGRSAADLNPLLEAGSDELERLAQEAHDVGAVMSKDTLDPLQEFQDALDSTTSVLKEAGAEIGAKFAPVLTSLQPIITEKIVPAIKKLADGIGNLFKWFNDLSPTAQKFTLLIVGLVVAIGPMLTIVGKLITAFGALSKAAAAASAAMATKGLTGAISAFLGPAGMAVAIIAAVAAIVGSMVIAFRDATAAARELREETDALLESGEASKKSYEEQIAEIESQAEVSKQLTSELYSLANKENKSNAEKARMKKLVQQLNDEYPDLALSINEVTGELNMESKAVQAIVDNQEKKAKYDAASQRYVSLLSEEIAYTKQLEIATAELAIAHDDVVEAEEMAANVHDDMRLSVMDEYKAYELAQSSVDDLTAALDDNRAEQILLQDEMRNSGWAADDYAESVSDAAYTVQDAIEAQSRALAEATQLAAEDIRAGFEEILNTQDIGMAESLRRMRKYAQDVREWGENIKSLAGRIPDDVYNELVAMGPSAATLIGDLADATDEELAKWVAAWRDAAGAAATATIGVLQTDEFIQSIKQAGRNAGFGFANGLRTATGEVVDAASGLAYTTTQTLKNRLMIASPSKLTKKLGQFTTLGFAGGIWDKAKEAFKAARNVAGGVMSSFATDQPQFAYAGVASQTAVPTSGGGTDVTSAIQSALSGFKGDVNLTVNLDGRTIATVTAPYMDTELRKKQTAIGRSAGQ